MQTKKFDIATDEGRCDCFAAFPDSGVHPGVVVLMDAFGPRPYLYDLTSEIASHGYYALLPNLFYRQKRAPVIDVAFPITKETLPEARAQLAPLFASFKPDAALTDMGFFLQFLSDQKEVRSGPVGLSGYCLGGGVALRAAALYDTRVGAVASFHAGRLATDLPTSPHLTLGKIKAKVYIAHADHDESMPREQIEKLRAVIQETGIDATDEIYKGAPHGFTQADLPAFKPAALERHWQNLLPLFEKTLKP